MAFAKPACLTHAGYGRAKCIESAVYAPDVDLVRGGGVSGSRNSTRTGEEELLSWVEIGKTRDGYQSVTPMKHYCYIRLLT
jgi:hypothetical protein